jgi:excinuclease ABC subunit B
MSRGRAPVGERTAGIYAGHDTAGMARADLADLAQQLTEQMLSAARDLQFELAGRLRDEIAELKREIRDMDEAGVAAAR